MLNAHEEPTIDRASCSKWLIECTKNESTEGNDPKKCVSELVGLAQASAVSVTFR